MELKVIDIIKPDDVNVVLARFRGSSSASPSARRPASGSSAGRVLTRP